MSQIKLQQLRCIPWGSNWNKVAHEILTQSVCTVADWCWCRPLFAKAHMEVYFILPHQPIFFKFVELGCFSITTFCLLFKFDNEAKSYLGGWCSDVLLRLSTSYVSFHNIYTFKGQTLNTLVDGPVMYFYVFFNPIFSFYLYFWASEPKYLGGWSGDVLLRLFKSYLFTLSIILGVRP